MANIPTLEQILGKFDESDLVTINDWDAEKCGWIQVSYLHCLADVMKFIKETCPNVLHKRVWRVVTKYDLLDKEKPHHTVHVC